MTNQQKLETVGRALYGDQWQAPLARDLGVATRSVQRWIAGDRETPDLAADLRPLVQKRHAELGALLTRLK
jgi:hypothetical protein